MSDLPIVPRRWDKAGRHNLVHDVVQQCCLNAVLRLEHRPRCPVPSVAASSFEFIGRECEEARTDRRSALHSERLAAFRAEVQRVRFPERVPPCLLVCDFVDFLQSPSSTGEGLACNANRGLHGNLPSGPWHGMREHPPAPAPAPGAGTSSRNWLHRTRSKHRCG